MIDKKRIEDEAQYFFEWPDPKHRDTVTLTSCVIFAATIAEMVNAENIGRGEKLADELRGEIARLHGAVCQAVALLNRADFGRSAEVVKVHDILREVLVSHADECQKRRAAFADRPRMRLTRMLKLYVATHEELTQKRVAQEAGISESSLSRFLSGEQMLDGRAFAALVAWCFGDHNVGGEATTTARGNR